MTRYPLLAALAIWIAAPPATDTFSRSFEIVDQAEVVATLRAACPRCDWGEAGREAAALRLSVDGRYSQHLLLTGGVRPYRVALGAFGAGRHQLTIDRDPDLSAPGAGAASIQGVDVAVITRTSDEFVAQSIAPILYARANTLGRFTDLPLLMWYEIVRTPRGRQFRYSVIFSNEDGGTPTDRLMATWGRATDIEFVYGAEVDDAGHVLAEEFQGPGHEVPPFTGRHEAAHPLLWVSTDNNMVSESGTTRVRYAPAPERFDLTDVSREAVMDAHPWIYDVMARELRREGKLADDPPAGAGMIPDPRRFVYVEACGTVGSAALAFAVNVGRASWIPSDRGLPQFRIVRDGCFRAAIPLPVATQPRDVRALRVRAYERPPSDGTPPPAGPVRVTRINKLFMLNDRFEPQLPLLEWRGSAVLAAGGEGLEISVQR